LALQDIVNEVGVRLDATVTHGRYRGTPKHVGLDGLWRFSNGCAIVIESRPPMPTASTSTRLPAIENHSSIKERSRKIALRFCSLLADKKPRAWRPRYAALDSLGTFASFRWMHCYDSCSSRKRSRTLSSITAFARF
jgi:hypothetical protein